MILGETRNPQGSVKRLTHNMECLLAIADSLNATGQVLGMLNIVISNPRTTLPEIASILRCDVVLSARIIRMSNSAFFVRTSNVCQTCH